MIIIIALPNKNGFLEGIFVVSINPAAPEIGTGAIAPVKPLSKWLNEAANPAGLS